MKKNLNVKKLEELQYLLRKNIKITPLKQSWEFVGGCDVSYRGEMGSACIVVMNKKGEIVDIACHRGKVEFPYIPNFLSFREIPFLYKAYKKLEVIPDVFMVDGQGIAHPRRLGLATHFGLLIKKPTIGVAKNPLTGSFSLPGIRKGDYSFLRDKNGEIIGIVLRTRDNVKPLYISPGHLIDFENSLKIVLHFVTKYRAPEPLRWAHSLSKKEIKNAA